ncbi:MAG: biotin/lipoyl-binding protein [Candidatus Wallbacteria bacterium]|nr:biotin/lipoyl-binding protein [Candidatus Wallbacteria bacterium]
MDRRIVCGEYEGGYTVVRKSPLSSEIEHGGRKYQVDWVPGGTFINGRYHDIEIQRNLSGEMTAILLDGEKYPLRVLSIDRVKVRSDKKGQAPRDGTMRAGLAGKVVSVAVEEGAEVAEGQLLLILEAMKMENEILSPGKGRVKAVQASPGQVVMRNEVLLELEFAETEE